MSDKNKSLAELGIFQGECTFPEERDRLFSEEIAKYINRVAHVITSEIKPFCSFSIQEEFIDASKPHYKSSFIIGVKSEFISGSRIAIHMPYKAKKKGVQNEYSGIVTISVHMECEHNSKAIVIILFHLYDKALIKYYPDWETIYESDILDLI